MRISSRAFYAHPRMSQLNTEFHCKQKKVSETKNIIIWLL